MHTPQPADAHEYTIPLAELLRPKNLDAIIGQEHLIGPQGPLRLALARGHIPSMIFWGPPGCGKTTLAQAIGHTAQATFHYLSAVLSGIRELRDLVDAIAKEQATLFATKHVVFVDEIHRWNKAQQDALLPYVERGTITLIGATTENPSFEIIGPLLSRCTVYVLHALDHNTLRTVATRALDTLQCGIEDNAREWLIAGCDGDARRLIGALENAARMRSGSAPITIEDATRAVQKKAILYDKSGEEHYHLISAFIKSMRASAPNAALYYLARMYEAGEDPRFLARRMVIFAAEDIGMAKPAALPFAVAAFQAYEIVGQAEGWIPLAEACVYLATAPKSNASYVAYQHAKADVEQHGQLPVPLHLRNAPTQLMKDLGYSKDYRYPHNDPTGVAAQTYLPDAIAGHEYYQGPKF